MNSDIDNDPLKAISDTIDMLYGLADKEKDKGNYKGARQLEIHVRDYLLPKYTLLKEQQAKAKEQAKICRGCGNRTEELNALGYCECWMDGAYRDITDHQRAKLQAMEKSRPTSCKKHGQPIEEGGMCYLCHEEMEY